MVFRAMAFDGGGIGGVFTATILGRIEQSYPQILKHVDAFAGTSTGAIIACALALKKPLSPKEILEFYCTKSPGIFKRKWIYRWIPLDMFFGTPYKIESLAKVLWEVFGDTRLGDLEKKVFIPTLDGDRERWKGARRIADAYFFNNISPNNRDLEFKVVDAILASAAAPLFFAPYRNRYFDGGLVLNNPSIGLISELIDAGIKRSDIALASIGTGKIPPHIDSNSKKIWDIRRFIKPVVASLTNSNTRVSTNLSAKLLDVNYFRFAPSLSRDYSIDRSKDIAWIVGEAENIQITPLMNWFQGFYRLYEQHYGASTKLSQEKYGYKSKIFSRLEEKTNLPMI